MMENTDPSSFYTGLVSELYRPLRSGEPDPDPYARFVEAVGQPALELGCGDGDPILELRRRGLDVEGVDSSADMLDRCRVRAADEGIDVVVHHQRMEDLDLGRRYRSIYLAGPTFTLLPDDDTASRALARIRDHLDPDDGGALVPLFVPPPIPPAEIDHVREAVDADGSTIRFTITAVTRDEPGRRQEAITRYERVQHGDHAGHVVLERPWLVHWHTQEGFRALAADAGLETVAVLGADGQPADPAATDVAFWLRARRRRPT